LNRKKRRQNYWDTRRVLLNTSQQRHFPPSPHFINLFLFESLTRRRWEIPSQVVEKKRPSEVAESTTKCQTMTIILRTFYYTGGPAAPHIAASHRRLHEATNTTHTHTTWSPTFMLFFFPYFFTDRQIYGLGSSQYMTIAFSAKLTNDEKFSKDSTN